MLFQKKTKIGLSDYRIILHLYKIYFSLYEHVLFALVWVFVVSISNSENIRSNGAEKGNIHWMQCEEFWQKIRKNARKFLRAKKLPFQKRHFEHTEIFWSLLPVCSNLRGNNKILTSYIFIYNPEEFSFLLLYYGRRRYSS